MKKTKNDIVAFPAFPAQVEAKSTRMKSSDHDRAVDGATVEVEDLRDAVSEADTDALMELVEQVPTPDDVVEFCRKKGVDEREVFGILGRIESVRRHCLFRDRAIMSISTSDILDGRPFPGVERTRIERVFASLRQRADNYERGYISYNDATSWPVIKPSLASAYLEIMRRLVHAMRQALIVVYRLDERVEDDASSDFVAPTAVDLANALIDDPDGFIDGLCVFLEAEPGQYEDVPCRLISDSAKKLEAERIAVEPVPFQIRGMEDLRDPGQPRAGDLHGNKPAQAPEDDVLVGIAKAFDRWFPGMTDEAMTHIIRHHALPHNQGRYEYIGRPVDAVRFWRSVGMRPYEWNKCFFRRGKESDPIGSKALKKGYKDKDDLKRGIFKGIYEPLHDYGLI